jgi:hypothetical protein
LESQLWQAAQHSKSLVDIEHLRLRIYLVPP